MKYLILVIAVIAISMTITKAGYAVDIKDLVTGFSCMKSAGVDTVIVRAYMSFGAVDPNAIANLNNAIAAQLNTDIYMFPCATMNASIQINQVIAAINSSYYRTIWLEFMDNPSATCDWSFDVNDNCNFAKSLVQGFTDLGLQIGILSEKDAWTRIFGSTTNCAYFSQNRLWYQDFDNSKDFKDWDKQKFGQWSGPDMKQYQGDQQLCGFDVNNDYYP